MSKIIINPGRKIKVEDVKKEVVLSKFEKYYHDEKKDFHCKHGSIKAKDIKKEFKIKKHNFFSFKSSFIDDYKQIRRGPQTIPLKDIGYIIAQTGLNKTSVVVEAGSGSGGFSCFVSNIVKHIYSFDIEKENIDIASNNAKNLKQKNIEYHNISIYDDKAISKIVKKADLLLLDVPEPWEAIKTAEKILKQGAYIVVYQPYMPQAIDFMNALTDTFIQERQVEVNIREWSFKDRNVRPCKSKIAHSGFLLFIRKVK